MLAGVLRTFDAAHAEVPVALTKLICVSSARLLHIFG